MYVPAVWTLSKSNENILANMGEEISEEYDWSSERKWCMGDPHYSGVDASVPRTKYYFRNWKRKIKTVRTRGKSHRRKNCDKNAEECPKRKKVRWIANKQMAVCC